jgi:hypothetical protein
MSKNLLNNLMKQAQQMQENMRKAQEELARVEVEGQSGAGLVKITITCRFAVKKVSIDPSLQPATMTPQPQTSWMGVPPLSLDPSLQPSVGLTPPPTDVTSVLPPNLRLPPPWLSPQPDGPNNHWADPVPPGPPGPAGLNGAIESLGTRPGLQIDGNGAGTTVDGWRLRGFPITPITPSPISDDPSSP